MATHGQSENDSNTKTGELKPPPNKKRRVDTIKNPRVATVLPKDLLTYILSFLRYRRGIILLLKTCKFFNQYIKNNPCSVKHYRFTKSEYSIDSCRLFDKIKFENTNNKSNINTFFKQFSQLHSLELVSMDVVLFKLLEVELDPIIALLFVQNMLKPLQNKLRKLIVNTWDDSALSAHSFHFGSIKFNNVTSLTINGKDTRYPFHITDYMPNLQSLTMVGTNIFAYSLFRMLFDTQKHSKHLLHFTVHNFSVSKRNSSDRLRFYDSKLKKIAHKVPQYDVSELCLNANGGHLQTIDCMWKLGETAYYERSIVLFVILFNRFTVKCLRTNYQFFSSEINLEHVGMEKWNGMNEFMAKHKCKKIICLPQLERLSFTMHRISAKEYASIENYLWYQFDAPKLKSIEIATGSQCWHDSNGFIRFVVALIGKEQFDKLKHIKIAHKDANDKTQKLYLQSSIERVQTMFQMRKQTIRIDY